jgi:hypothetical protein
MKPLVVAAGLALVVVTGTSAPGEAGELRPTVLAPNPFAMTPPPAPLVPRPAAPAPPRPPVTPPVTVFPCCAAGYWAYQWVPTTSTTYVWVPGYVAEDGTMVAGGYWPQIVTGGYYQPVWVPN